MKTANTIPVQSELKNDNYLPVKFFEKQISYGHENSNEIKHAFTGGCKSKLMGKPGTTPLAEGNSTFSTGHPCPAMKKQSMNGSIALYPQNQENNSEKHLKVVSRNTKAQMILRKRQRAFKNFKVHTTEQAEVFEKMFGFMCNDFCTKLKIQYPTLSIIERIILAFQHIEFSEAEISRNIGLSLEDFKRHFFIINKKMNTSAVQLQESLSSLLQEC